MLDIYATSIDYDPKAEVSVAFFKKVQRDIQKKPNLFIKNLLGF